MAEQVILKATTGTHVNSSRATTSYYSASKATMYVGGTYQSFLNTTMPTRKVGRKVIAARLEQRMAAGSGDRTLTVQRTAKWPKTPNKTVYSSASRPAVLPGSTPVSKTQSAGTTTWALDVTVDVAAYMAGAAFYGWRFTSTHGSAWGMYGWASRYPPKLVVEYADQPGTPTGLAPHGTGSVAAPTVTWTAPTGVVSAQVRVASDETMTTILFDTGVVDTTVAQLNLAALGWAGVADGGQVWWDVVYSNVAGPSPRSLPAKYVRNALDPVTITGPPSPTPDPSPTAVWQAYADQKRWQVLTIVDGVTVDDSGIQPGDDTAYTPAKGAKTSGQNVTQRVNVWDSVARTASPGDPGYASAARTVTYTPGTAAPVSSLVATQGAGGAPWVDLTWTRLVGGQLAVADEWLIYRATPSETEWDLVTRIDGVGPQGDPVWGYRDWACPPNTLVAYIVVPVTNGAAQAFATTPYMRTVITGAWLFEPQIGGDWFVWTGEQQNMGFGESSTVYELIGGSATVKRTYSLRGLEGTIGGRLDDQRTGGLAAAEAAVMRIKGKPSAALRCAYGDVNFPCSAAQLQPLLDTESAFIDNIVKTMTVEVRQSGELPFDPITPETAST